jgi:hypothetical protein
MDALEQDHAAIKIRAMAGLEVIAAAINAHRTTGGAKRLVRFLAGMYNGADYPFDRSELRGLDTTLANACMHYLNYVLEFVKLTDISRMAIGICSGGSRSMGSCRRSAGLE